MENRSNTKGSASPKQGKRFDGFARLGDIVIEIGGSQVTLTFAQAHDVWIEQERRFFTDELEYRLRHLDEYPQYQASLEAIEDSSVSAEDFLQSAWDAYLGAESLTCIDECAGV